MYEVDIALSPTWSPAVQCPGDTRQIVNNNGHIHPRISVRLCDVLKLGLVDVYMLESIAHCDCMLSVVRPRLLRSPMGTKLGSSFQVSDRAQTLQPKETDVIQAYTLCLLFRQPQVRTAGG